MCVSWKYPDNTIPAILYVKSNDGKLYPIRPLDDNSEVYSTIYGKFRDLGLIFTYDRSDEPKPVGNDFVATDPSSDYVTNIARYTYKINNNAEQNSEIQNSLSCCCKNGEIFVHPDTVLTNDVSLPCTLMIGKNLYYYYGNINQGYGYHYAMGAQQTIEITEPGTYHVEKISTGSGWYLTTPPAWYGFSTDIVVERVGVTYKITAKDFTYYTKDAAIKYYNWINRSLATTIKLDEYGNGSKSLDITYLTDRIKTLEQRVAELEALHNNE